MCKNSEILSLKYSADRNRHWFERMWWFCLVAVSFCYCAYLMNKIWHRRSLHPVNVVLDDKISTIDAIPFPAVTVCPATKISAKKLNITEFKLKYTKKWPQSFQNASSEELRLNHANWLCRYNEGVSLISG